MMAVLQRPGIRRALAIALVAFVSLVWLNQSVGSAAWLALRERTFADPSAHVADYVRYPLIFLYRRSSDEELYHATASAVLGQPYDKAVFATRGYTPLPPIETPVDGRFHVPYLEVPFEYPPPNVPFVILPRMLAGDFTAYARLFCGIMGALLVASAVVGARLGARGDRHAEVRRLVTFALLLLAHGAIAIQRLDAIVALLCALVVRAGVRRQDGRLGFYAGLVGAAKMVPVLVLPVVVLAAGIRAPRRLLRVAAGALGGIVLGLGPMIALSPGSLPMVLAYHGKRGLHVESSLGVLYGALAALAGRHQRSTVDYGSFNFHGALADLLAKLSMPLTVILVSVVAAACAAGVRAEGRGEVDDARLAERVPLAVLAALVALWLGGKVFSPQYLTWALPVVIAIPGRRGQQAALGLGVVLVLSQLYLRGFYDHVYNQWPAGVITMVVRLALLVVGFVVLVRGLGGGLAARLGSEPDLGKQPEGRAERG